MRVEPVNFVDEEHVTLFEIGQKCGEIAGLRDHRTRGRTKVHAEFARNDLRERSSAQPRRPDQEHMIQRFFPRLRRLDEDGKICARLLLADESASRADPQMRVGGIVVASRSADTRREFMRFQSADFETATRRDWQGR